MENQENKKVPFAQELLESQQEAIKTKATAQALGVDLGGDDKKGSEDNLATTIVTKAMESTEKSIDRMTKNTEKLEGEVKTANQAVAEMQWQLLSETLKRIEETQKRADESAQKAAAAGAPKDAFGYYHQVKEELQTLVKDIPQQQPQPQTGGMSESTQVRLKEIELEQMRILEEIRQENLRANQEFQLKLQEFQDNKEIRRLEYDDKRRFREDGLHGVTDIVMAISNGISAERGAPADNIEEPARPSRVKSDLEGEEIIGSFECNECGKEVTITAGETIATCPGCGSKYSVEHKE